MSLLGLILIFGLQFKAAISVEIISIYKRSGHDATLSCGRASSSDTSCSIIKWLYSRDRSSTVTVAEKGKVKTSSARAARMSLDTSCSLVIRNITAEDAGRYDCWWPSRPEMNVITYLSVLTISPSPPDADPKRDGEVVLNCTLWRFPGLPCKENRIRWVNETRTVLLGEGVGYEFLRQTNCVSVLKVKRQSGHDRKYTCQFVDEKNKVQIEADYTPVFTGSAGSTDGPLSSVMFSLRIAGLILMIVTTVLIIRGRGFIKPLDKDNNVHEDGGEVNYENVEARPAATGRR